MGGMPTEGSTGAAGLGLNKISGTQTKRVVSVIYDASHDFYEGLQSIGRIFYEDANSVSNERIGEPSLNLTNSALPITSNNQFFPLIGELVLVVKTVSNKPVTQRDEHYKNQNYYYPPIRVHNQSSHNAFPFKYKIGNSASNEELKQKAQDGSPNKAVKNQTPTFPLGEYFIDKDIKRLIPFEGDYIIEGRFGNSIRFGATTPFNIDKPIEEQSFPNPWSIGSIDGENTSDKTKAQIGDPITIIRNGQKVDLNESDSTLEDYLEDINGDHSSIYMCSNQKLIDFQVAGTTTASPPIVKNDSYLPTGSTPTPQLDLPIPTEFNVVGGAGTNVIEGIGGSQTSGLSTSVTLPVIDEPIQKVDLITAEYPDFVLSAEDDTEDGLSFYNEMVERSGVVAADHFTEEEFSYEDVSVSGTITEDPGLIVSEEGPANTPNGNNNNNTTTGGSPPSYGGLNPSSAASSRDSLLQDPGAKAKTVTKASIEEEIAANGYPVTVPQRTWNKYVYRVYKPLSLTRMLKLLNGAQPTAEEGYPELFAKAPNRVQALVIHTNAGSAKGSILDNIYTFAQTKENSAGKKVGWSKHGYHITIDWEGKSHKNVPDSVSSNGIGGYGSQGYPSNNTAFPVTNANVMNITWLGGEGDGTRGRLNITKAQGWALNQIVKNYIKNYPNILILGHNQITAKACPIFYVPEWAKWLNIPTKNVWGNSYTGFKGAGENPGASGGRYIKNAKTVAYSTGMKSDPGDYDSNWFSDH